MKWKLRTIVDDTPWPDYSRDIIRRPLDLSSLSSARLTATLPSILEAFWDAAANAAIADAPIQPAMDARKWL